MWVIGMSYLQEDNRIWSLLSTARNFCPRLTTMDGQGMTILCLPALRVSLISLEPNMVDANPVSLLSIHCTALTLTLSIVVVAARYFPLLDRFLLSGTPKPFVTWYRERLSTLHVYETL